ncbi:MAG: hypothetical protein IPK26_06200 [Planctomycetes bacterium]|nr:hypothetical protein [Planctomycetota bacterium]
MLATILSLGLLVQASFAGNAAAMPAGDPSADAVAIRGDAELTPAAALTSARRKAEELFRQAWTERARRLADGVRPFWLPAVFTRQATDRWLANLPVDRALRIVDREDKRRDHEFGASWQTTLWVVEDARAIEVGERQLRQELRRCERQTLAKSGATIAFWAVLGFAIGWLDRLSRGYMTGRLRLLGLLLGAGVPTLLFLL